MAWIWLGLAIVCEGAWVIGLRFIEGWSRLWPSAFVVAFYALGLIPLSLAGRSIPSSTLYSVWVGGGIVLVALADLFYFGEPVSAPKLVCIGLILAGAVGLKVLSGAH